MWNAIWQRSFPNYENLNKNNSQVHLKAPTNGSIPPQVDPHKKCVRLKGYIKNRRFMQPRMKRLVQQSAT